MDITEKKLTTILRKELTLQREEYQRYLGVVAENFESQVKLLAEAVEGVQNQLVSLRDMVAKNTEDIEIMKVDLRIIRNELRTVPSRDEFALVEKRLAVLEKKVDARK